MTFSKRCAKNNPDLDYKSNTLKYKTLLLCYLCSTSLKECCGAYKINKDKVKKVEIVTRPSSIYFSTWPIIKLENFDQAFLPHQIQIFKFTKL